MCIGTLVVCKFRYADYKNRGFFARHHPAGNVHIKAQLMVRVLERGPEILVF